MITNSKLLFIHILAHGEAVLEAAGRQWYFRLAEQPVVRRCQTGAGKRLE
jgi:hypothetical protein